MRTHFIGIDLAWGDARPTGVAVLDDAGTLVHLAEASDDASIDAAIAPYVEGPFVMGIDAPLVVENATGNRKGEAALNRDFGRFDAGAHPSNTGKPEFRAGTRGARLAERHRADIDPESTARRRALEVYPHPATVSLFRLGRTLKYKQKTGRTLDTLRSELRELARLVTTLEGAAVPMRVAENPQWQALVKLVDEGRRKSDLRRAEDPIDAVICAYVAMLAAKAPETLTTYGDLAEGYIVTPTLPAGLEPTPRTPSVTSAVQVYAGRLPELRVATERYLALITTLLDDAGINYLSISGRTKSVASFAAKADRSVAGRPLYPDPLTDITDQVGVRVITYLRSDVDAVAKLLNDELAVLDDRDMGEETASEGRFGYASRHLLVAQRPGGPDPAGHPELGAHRASVQIRTVLQHAWAEFEHAIRYKGTIPQEHASDLDRRFTLAAGLLELADREFSEIRDRLQTSGAADRQAPDAADPRIGVQELATFLSDQFSDAGWSRPDHYEWVAGLLLELGITSIDELSGMLAQVDGGEINATMGYRYPPGAVRRLDDALLAVYGEDYLGLHGNAHRVEALRDRLAKLRGAG